MKLTVLILLTATTFGLGCSKPSSSEPAAALSSRADQSNRPSPIKIPGPTAATPAASTAAVVPVPQVPDEPLTPAQETQRIEKLTKAYVAETKWDGKRQLLLDLTESGTEQALDGLLRLFPQETDGELKQQMIDALADFENLNDRKLTLLQDALRPTQPPEVRQSGVEALALLKDQRVLPILQGLLTDPTEDIRESARVAIEELKTTQPSS